MGWPGLRTELQLPPLPGGQARLSGGGFLLVRISLHLHALVSPYCLEMQFCGCDLICVSELEGLVLVEVAVLLPLQLPCKVKWNQMSHKLLAQKGSFKTRSRAGMIWVTDGGLQCWPHEIFRRFLATGVELFQRKASCSLLSLL